MISDNIILTDGGLETDFIFNRDINLPHFASFPLLEDPIHRLTLQSYYKDYLNLAMENKTGFILESPTWRSSQDWGYKLGYTKEDIQRVNEDAIRLLHQIRRDYSSAIENIYVSGCVGPRGDGYTIQNIMDANDAKTYHSHQIEAFTKAKADMVCAMTISYINEALGITMAAKEKHIPVVISFTVELDGNLPSGETLQSAIDYIDEVTDMYPSYYMINCAHPSHFFDHLKTSDSWKSRIKGIRANASCKSHEELDASDELDTGDKTALGEWYLKLKKVLPDLIVFGGCCGTDASHIESICNHIIK